MKSEGITQLGELLTIIGDSIISISLIQIVYDAIALLIR